MEIKTIIVSCHRADSKAVKQEVNGTVILTLLILPSLGVSATATVKVVSGASMPRVVTRKCLAGRVKSAAKYSLISFKNTDILIFLFFE